MDGGVEREVVGDIGHAHVVVVAVKFTIRQLLDAALMPGTALHTDT